MENIKTTQHVRPIVCQDKFTPVAIQKEVYKKAGRNGKSAQKHLSNSTKTQNPNFSFFWKIFEKNIKKNFRNKKSEDLLTLKGSLFSEAKHYYVVVRKDNPYLYANFTKTVQICFKTRLFSCDSLIAVIKLSKHKNFDVIKSILINNLQK